MHHECKSITVSCPSYAGIPGQEVGAVAGPSDTVCSNCDAADGTCYNNVLRQGRLTSGYLSGQLIGGSSVTKPANSGTYGAAEETGGRYRGPFIYSISAG